jgi:hypothetical protein
MQKTPSSMVPHGCDLQLLLSTSSRLLPYRTPVGWQPGMMEQGREEREKVPLLTNLEGPGDLQGTF